MVSVQGKGIGRWIACGFAEAFGQGASIINVVYPPGRPNSGEYV